MMDRLKKKYQTAKQYLPKPISHKMPGATVGILGYGSTEAAILEARHQIAPDHNIKADFLRIRSLPFGAEVTPFIKKNDKIFVVEMNRHGQMQHLLTMEYPEHAALFSSLPSAHRLPPSTK